MGILDGYNLCVCRCQINGNKKWTSPISNGNQKVSIRNSDTYFWWPRFEAVTLCDHFYIPQYQLCRCICPGMSKRMSFSDEMEHVFLIIVNLYQCIDIVLFHSISVPFISCWPTVFRGPLNRRNSMPPKTVWRGRIASWKRGHLWRMGLNWGCWVNGEHKIDWDKIDSYKDGETELWLL